MGVCGQADTRVAEIVGSRRSDANACSGSSRVIRLRSWRGGGGDGGGGVCPRSLSELQYSKQGAAVSQPAVKRDEPLTASRAPPACLPSLLLHTPSTHRSLTHDSLRGRRRLPPWARPATSKCSACARWKDDHPLHDLACATDTCSQHRRGQTIQGTRRTTRDAVCPNDSRRFVPAKGV